MYRPESILSPVPLVEFVRNHLFDSKLPHNAPFLQSGTGGFSLHTTDQTMKSLRQTRLTVHSIGVVQSIELVQSIKSGKNVLHVFKALPSNPFTAR